MSQLRVNLRTKVLNSAIRYEKRDGRDVIVVPSATLPDGIVMNRILYPAAAIEQGYQSLSRTPAPLGHPMVNGEYVPALQAEAINGFWVGAWNENVTRRNGRVFLDKVIDIETAKANERGRKLLDTINKQEPISTSTGLMLTMTPAQHKDYDWVANTIEADHDAILIGEAPAASTQQGVGIFVNSQGARVDVQNAEIEITDDELESIAKDIAWRLEHEAKEEKRKPLIETIMQKLRSLLSGLETTEGDALSVNTKEGNPMDEKEKQAFDALQKQVETLTNNALTSDKLTEALKPLTDSVAAITANIQAQDEAKKTELVARVVKANVMSEDTAKTLSVNALTELVSKLSPEGDAAPIFGARVGNSDDSALRFDLPGGAE